MFALLGMCDVINCKRMRIFLCLYTCALLCVVSICERVCVCVRERESLCVCWLINFTVLLGMCLVIICVNKRASLRVLAHNAASGCG